MVDGTSLLTFRPDSLFKALESTMLSTTRAFSRPSFVTLSSFRSPLIRTRPPTAMLLWSSSHAVPRVRRKSRKATKDDIEPPVLEKTLREIEKDFGKNVLIRLVRTLVLIAEKALFSFSMIYQRKQAWRSTCFQESRSYSDGYAT